MKRKEEGQLDLFADVSVQATPPYSMPLASAATVVHLPVRVWGPTIWRPKVLRTVEVMAGMTPRNAAAYWQRTTKSLLEQFIRRGAGEVEAADQLELFRRAVEATHSRQSA